jgi:transcriptional regulator with XRE-family HTH domain
VIAALFQVHKERSALFEMDVGYRIRALRQQKGMSLRELAKRANLSASFISQLERNLSQPSVGSLKQLADVLDVKVHQLLVEADADITSPVLVRRGERLTWNLANTTYQLLTSQTGRLMQPQLVTYEPGADMGAHPITHEGEEFGMLLEGRSEFRIGDEVFVLESGDSVYFDATIPHTLRNNGDTPCVWLHVVTPSSF